MQDFAVRVASRSNVGLCSEEICQFARGKIS